MFNYNHLYYFYKTVRLNGVTPAARALRIAQPSLSMQLKTLERELDTVLFEKVGRRLKLTATGERIFEYCRTMYEAAEELDDFLKHSAGAEPKRCRIGVSREIERPFVADVLSSLLHKNKSIEKPYLTMLTSEHKDLVSRLTSGEIDVIVTNHAVGGSGVKTLAELSMPVLAVANIKRLRGLSPTAPLVKRLKSESAPDLVLPSEALKIRFETDLYLQKHKIRNAVVFESDILSVVVRAVLEGVGVGFLPKHYIQKELSKSKLVALNDGSPLWMTRLYVTTRSKKIEDPLVQLIKDHFLKLAADT